MQFFTFNNNYLNLKIKIDFNLNTFHIENANYMIKLNFDMSVWSQ